MLIACLSAQFELHYSAAAPDQVSSLVTIVIEQVRRLQRGRAVSGVLRLEVSSMLDMTRLVCVVWFWRTDSACPRVCVVGNTQTAEVT